MGGRRRRGGLADLIGEVGAEPEAREDEGPRPDAATEAPEASRGNRRGSGGEDTETTPARRTVREEAAAPTAPVPKYLALERKETRLRSDQVDFLSALTRRVNRQKVPGGVPGGGERITENTLIRVAVDLLRSQEQYVGGSTEEGIRRGLGLPEPR